ncbi:MAG: recombinase family protein [Oscillospiraceae bacterium]|nr:recombinase family protein [Oscillospiraceae bacterium]
MHLDQYALYLRKSRKDADAEKQGEEETLKRHETILLDLAKRQGLNIGEIYREVVSGDSIDARPEMQRLLTDVHNHRWRGVLVVELERLARGDTKDQGVVAEAFKYSETLIVTPTKTYDPNNEFDEEYFEFGLFMSRREYKTIKRRLQAGVKLSVLEGNYLSPVAPYGYDIVDRGRRDRTLTPNEHAKTVQMMFDWYTREKISFCEIAQRLTDMHISSPSGLNYWTPFSVTKIIKNDIYHGMVRHGLYKQTKEYDQDTKQIKTVQRLASPDEITTAKGKHPPLVDDATWEAAVARHSRNTRIRKGSQLSNPLAGLMRCSQCGTVIQYKETIRPTKQYYWFRHRPDTTQRCNCQSADYQEVMDAVARSLQNFINDFTTQLKNADGEAVKQHAAMLDEMEKNLSAMQARRKDLFEYFEKKIYTEEEFLERKGELNTQIETLSARIAETRATQPAEIDYREKIVKFSAALDALRDPDATPKKINDLLKEIVSKISYSRPDRTQPFVLDITLV